MTTPEQIVNAVVREIQRQSRQDPLAELDWHEWNKTVAPIVTSKPYADHHRRFWQWADEIRRGQPATPFAALWPRGHAKSACAEVAAVKWGCRNVRRYGLYVSATQDLADQHIDSIAAILESKPIEKHYPLMGERRVGKFGNSKGWRRNRLTTATGFTIDALGLDTSPRGLRQQEQRPDFVILDDIDDQDDSPATVNRKIGRIARAIIPAGSGDLVVLMAQNMVHVDSVVARMRDGRTDLLSQAEFSGPLPAIRDLKYETRAGNGGRPRYAVTGGEPTWEGMGVAECENRINLSGLDAFIIESQQQISERKGALWTRALINETRVGDYPELSRIAVGVDPNKTGRGDDAGVVVVGAGIGDDGLLRGYVLDDATQLTNPERWRDEAAELYLEWGAGMFVVERTGLGEHASLTLRDAPALRGLPVTVEPVEARLSKEDRARPVAQLYKDGRIHHVGTFPVLEGQMTSWRPGHGKSPGGIDALVHVITHLLIDETYSEPWADIDDLLGPGGMGQVSW